MSVFIASMNMRGKWAERPDDTIAINVTSAQAKNNKNRRDFSPMTAFSVADIEDEEVSKYYNFEAFWQSGKVYKDIPEQKTKRYWLSVQEPKRRFPASKGKRVLFSCWENVNDNEPLNYIESRKQVYVPFYHSMIKDREMTKYWQAKVKLDKNIVVYDFDGPRNENGEPICLPVSKELLIEKLSDPTFPFGHGYIVSALLAGIDIEEILQE